ncbi:MAG: VCBS domain-containing protein [Dysosmobacter sp.]
MWKDRIYQTLSKDDVEGYYVYDSDTAGGNYSYQYGDKRDHVLTVYYTEQTYTVEASIVAENADNEPGGTITPPSKTVNKGGDQTVTWTIDEGYEIVKVEVDGKDVVDLLDKNSYDFTNISANHTVKVTTRPIEYSVVFQRGESGKLEGSDYENSDWFWRLVDTVKSWILGEDKVASMNQYTYKFTIEDLNDGAALSAETVEAKITVDDYATLLGFYRDGDSSAAKYVDLQTAYETMRDEDATTITYVALYDKTPWVGSFRHNVMEDGNPDTAEGNALKDSVKGDGTHTFAWGNETAQYGTMTKNANGTYTYVLDNTKEAVRELNAGDTLTETFTFSYTDKDGDKATGSVTITIYGVDDYTVIYAPGDHGTWDAENYTTPRLFKGDPTPAAPDADAANMHEPGYTFAGWNPTRTDTVTGNVTYTAQWTANDDTKYTVEYYYQQMNGSYSKAGEDEREGTTGDTAKLTAEDQKPGEGLGVTGKNYALASRPGGWQGHRGRRQHGAEVYFKLQFTVTYQPGDHGTFSRTPTAAWILARRRLALPAAPTAAQSRLQLRRLEPGRLPRP